jgi:chromosomal replication initiator protein
MPFQLDTRFTFDAFVVGPDNRLAVAAARRVAEDPGGTYNPLFIHSGSGLGKTHLLTAIGLHAQAHRGQTVVLETLERVLERASEAVAAGDADAFHVRVADAGILLLDDIQFLAGQRQAQEALMTAWDAVARRGGQVVLTSDRPPADIDGLDERLLDRLSGGLLVDIAPPDYETRVAIARRKAAERGQSMAPGVYEILARIAFANVRELQGALNRLIAVQELEERAVEPEEVPGLLGAAADRGRDELGELRADIAHSVEDVVQDGDRVLGDAILRWEGEGYRTRRLEAALESGLGAQEAAEVLRRFERDAGRLARIEAEIREIDPEARELTADALRDPARIADAEGLLAGVRERHRPPPGPPDAPALDALDGDSLALRAARAVADAPGGTYNPLYILGPAGVGKTTLLAAIGHAVRERDGAVVGYADAERFEADLIDALEHSRLDAWRARYRRADLLLIDDLHRLAGMERAQEELFHLFEELHRTGRQLVFAADAAPQDLDLPERLRSRLEGGLVVELDPPGDRAGAPSPDTTAGGAPAATPDTAPAPVEAPAEAPAEARGAAVPGWLTNREKVLWEWPYPGDWIEESLD